MHEEDKEEIYHKDDAIQELKEKVKHYEELEIENDKKLKNFIESFWLWHYW